MQDGKGTPDQTKIQKKSTFYQIKMGYGSSMCEILLLLEQWKKYQIHRGKNPQKFKLLFSIFYKGLNIFKTFLTTNKETKKEKLGKNM